MFLLGTWDQAYPHTAINKGPKFPRHGGNKIDKSREFKRFVRSNNLCNASGTNSTVVRPQARLARSNNLYLLVQAAETNGITHAPACWTSDEDPWGRLSSAGSEICEPSAMSAPEHAVTTPWRNLRHTAQAKLNLLFPQGRGSPCTCEHKIRAL